VFVVIIGCGRLGSHIASELSKLRHDVVVVDRNEEAFALLSADFSGFQLVGDGTEQEILRSARVGEADVLAAVTEDDNANLMIAQAAGEIFGVKRLLARVSDPVKGDIYRGLSLGILCPTIVSAEAFEAEILQKEIEH
jgi:trk system potassium uptake protein TrkA